MQLKTDTNETKSPPAATPEMTPERAAHLRSLNAVKTNFRAVATGKYLSRTPGDQQRG